jgi:hypothetical protein
MKAASVILLYACALVAMFYLGWKTNTAWHDAVAVQAAKMQRMDYDCTMPCPIPEDPAMHPNNPKGKRK